MLLQVLAVHLWQVTKLPTTFSFPAGALALSTAAVECALMLFKSGINAGDEKTTHGTHAFNNPWGGITCVTKQWFVAGLDLSLLVFLA